MDFKLTEEQIMIRTMVREFAQKEVKPLSRVYDAKVDPKDCIAWELVDRAAELGLKTLALPEELGGAAADLLTRIIVQEELGAADLGFADLMRDHGAKLRILNKVQLDEFLPQYLADPRFFHATAITEPDHGTDPQLRLDAPEASIQTFAERRGDEYIINGRKHFISHGGIAKLYFVHARTHKSLPISQCESAFLVPANTPGLSIGSFHNKLGRRLLINAEIILEDVRIPTRYLVGEIGKGGEAEHRHIAVLALLYGADIVGLLRCCYEESLAYANTRIQGNKPIIQHPTIALKLADMKIKIEAARTLIWRCAWCWQNNYDYDPKMALSIKSFINGISKDILDKTVDIHGGMGTDKSLPIEKYLRDAYTSLHGFGSSEIALIRNVPSI